jgi:hypothetical protein
MAKSEALLSFVYSFSIWIAFDFSPVLISIVNIFMSNNLVYCKVRVHFSLIYNIYFKFTLVEL